MLDRLYLVFFLSLFATICCADEANWNCKQDKSTKEWVCVGSTAPANKPSNKVPEPESGQPPVQADDNKAIENREPALTPSKTEEPGLADTLEKENRLPETKPVEAEVPADIEQSKEKSVEPIATPIDNQLKPQPSQTSEASKVPSPIISASKKPVLPNNKPLPVDEGKPKGWNCDTKGKDGNWNCNLVGADPKGEPRVVEAEEHGFNLFNPTFDDNQERIFMTLRDRFKTNPWASCNIQVGSQKTYVPGKNLRATADMDMNSNYSEIFDNEIGNYQGNVEMKRADQQASSNSANYDSVSETLDLHGDVYYSEDELSVHTDTATLKLASDEARLRDTSFIFPTTPIRGMSKGIYRDSKSLSRFKDVLYTSCEPGNQDWIVHASDLKINRTAGRGSAKNAWIEFKGVPVFYSPYLSFPTDDRRKSGFLAPVFGRTQKGGFILSTPFYWNIAPNYDAIIKPRYYDRRGALLGADFRYMTKNSVGEFNGEFMPNDTITGKSRYLATFKNTTKFSPHINSNLDLNIVSDKTYFSELGNALSFPYFSNVKSTADISYVDEGVSLVGRLVNYQAIDPTLTGRLRPYRTLPQIDLNLNHAFESVPANTALDTEYVFFQHDQDTSAQVPEGHRFNIKPSVSFPLETSSAYVTPKIAVQHTQYLLSNQNPVIADTIGRTVPIASVDSGLFFEKDVNLFGNSLLHTLEPRLFYLFVPKVNQDHIPIFDTSLYDFQFNSLFRENRFNGLDRIQDANQVSLALTSRLVDSKTGLEKLKFSIGDIFYFQDRTVTAPVVRIGTDFLQTPVQTSTVSPLVAELSSQFNEHFSADTGMQWDSDSNDIVRGKAALHFVNNPGEILNLGFLYRKNNLIRDALDSALVSNTLDDATRARFQTYRNTNSILRSNDIIQSDVSFRFPITNDWFAVGRWQYSFLYDKTQDAFFGFEKENCCWRFRIIGRQYINNINNVTGAPQSIATAQAHSQTGIFFQIEFKGLTGIGESLDDFFTQSIYGYRKPEK